MGIERHIEWSVSVAPNAKGGPKLVISANIAALQPGDKPVGVAVTFDPRRADLKAVRKANKNLQKRVIERYAKFNIRREPRPGPTRAEKNAAIRDELLQIIMNNSMTPEVV